MGNCEKLKWNRRKLGLSQKEFADKVGVSIGTISRLETDETTWETMQDVTFDKIFSAFDGKDAWPMKNREVQKTIEPEEEPVKVEEKTEVSWAERVVCMINNNGITEQDTKTMSLLEFVLDGLKEAENHEEFVANIKLLKRILKDY